jgi:ATP-dependent phosphoenolpyruvate carboxykinase
MNQLHDEKEPQFVLARQKTQVIGNAVGLKVIRNQRPARFADTGHTNTTRPRVMAEQITLVKAADSVKVVRGSASTSIVKSHKDPRSILKNQKPVEGFSF